MASTEHPVPSPDARLLAAATRLRTLLADPELTAGPWLNMDNGDRLLRNQPGDEDRAPVYVVNEPMSNAANADWIEAMDPIVGAAIVAVLEQAVRSYRASVTAAERIWGSIDDPDAKAWLETGAGAPPASALALADAILATADGAAPAAPRTPCSVPPCDTGPGEPCDRHEREEAHAAGEHELCGPECVTAYALTRGEPGDGGEQA